MGDAVHFVVDQEGRTAPEHCMPCRYGAEQGKPMLREAICNKLYAQAGRKPSEIFVSDGSKCDIGRLQVRIFGCSSSLPVLG